MREHCLHAGDRLLVRRKAVRVYSATLLPKFQRIAVAFDGHPYLSLCGNTELAVHFGTSRHDFALQGTVSVAEMRSVSFDQIEPGQTVAPTIGAGIICNKSHPLANPSLAIAPHPMVLYMGRDPCLGVGGHTVD